MKHLMLFAAILVCFFAACGGAELPRLPAAGPLTWPGGEKEAATVLLRFEPPPGKTPQKFLLESRSPNRFWSISAVRLYGIDGANRKLLAERPWYNRDKDNSEKVFRLELEVPALYSVYELELRRPHKFLYMELSAFEPVYAGEADRLRLKTDCAPDSGSPDDLSDGKPLIWQGGKGKPAVVTLTLRLPDQAEVLRKLTLRSRSVNKWWSISKVRLTGVRADGSAAVLFEQPWYNRGDENTNRTFQLEIEPGGEPFPEYRLSLSRPHGFIGMELSGLDMIFANQIRTAIRPLRSACRIGQTAEGTVEFHNTGAAAIGRIVLELVSGTGRTEVWSAETAIPAGDGAIAWSFPAEHPGEFRLEARLEGSRKLTPAPSGIFLILPKRSRYHMDIGTAHGSAQSGALGFTVRHEWGDAAKLSDQELTGELHRDKLIRSNCNVKFETDEDGRFMVNADGQTLKNIAMHVPRRVGPELAATLKRLNGHPGFGELVYYNEHGYQTWAVSGLADYSRHTVAFFHRYLRELHGDIGKLNALYGSDFPDFDAVEPPRRFDGSSPAWYDWMEFRRHSVAAYFQEAYRLLKPLLPDTPITPKPINFDYYAAATATDPWLFRDACDVYGYDLYPFQREGYLDPAMSLDYHRTQVGGKDLKFLESNFEFRRERFNQTEKRPEDMHLLYMPAFLRGLRGVYFYCWYQRWSERHLGFWLRNADGVLTPQGRGAAQVAKAARTLAPVLMTGRPLPAAAAVYFPWEEISQTPNVAPVSALRGAYKMMVQLGYQTDIISRHNIAAGELGNYRVLLLPLSRHLRPETAAAITGFVENGGILITEYQAGRFDQYHRECNLLAPVLGVKPLGTTDQYATFTTATGKELKLYAPITKESPFGWKHRPNIAPIDRAEKIEVVPEAKIVGVFPDNTPAAVEHVFGKGHVLYFASTFFNSYRNYFYTLTTLPTPATRGNEITNAGDREMRAEVQRYLAARGLKPETRLGLSDTDIEKDDSAFIIASRFANDRCALFGVVNWGPHERNQVRFETDLPFDGVKRLFLFDTCRETIAEIPFREANRTLSAVIPQLDKSVILIAVGQGGPLLARATQQGAGQAVEAELINFLPETAVGTAQLRVDGVPEALSEPVPFSLKAGETTKLRLAPRPGFAPELLRDNRGERLPWYVWVTYDGDACSFARVHPNADGVSAP